MRQRIDCGLLAFATIALSACDIGGGGDRELASDTAEVSADTAASAGATADERFLRQMADHHEGLVLIAQRAQERAQDDSVSAAADRLHRTQVEERDSMLALLSSAFQVDHTPQVLQRHRAQADSITGLPIGEHDRYFLSTVIAHRREGIALIDLHGSGLRNRQVRSMAAALKAAQEREIDELEAKLGTL